MMVLSLVAFFLFMFIWCSIWYFAARWWRKRYETARKILAAAYAESHHTFQCFAQDRRPDFCICWKHDYEKMFEKL